MSEVKSSRPMVDREKTCPFLLRTFVRLNSFHPLSLFDPGTPPLSDEYDLYTWRDATLKELATLLRAASPTSFRNPLVRFSFRLVFADGQRGGMVGSRELGVVHARELVNHGGLSAILEGEGEEKKDGEDEPMSASREKGGNGHALGGEDRTLEEMRFVPGDYLSVAVMTPHANRVASGPQSAGPGNGTGFGIRGMGARGGGPLSAGGRGGRGGGDAGWGGTLGGGAGRGGAEAGGHWRGGGRGGATGAGPVGRGAGRGGGMGRERDDDDRRGGFGRRGGDRDFPARDRDRDRERLDRDLDRGWDRPADRDRKRDDPLDWGRDVDRDRKRDDDLDWGRDLDRKRDDDLPSRRPPLPNRDTDDVDMDVKPVPQEREGRRDSGVGSKRRRSPSYSPYRRSRSPDDSRSRSRTPVRRRDDSRSPRGRRGSFRD